MASDPVARPNHCNIAAVGESRELSSLFFHSRRIENNTGKKNAAVQISTNPMAVASKPRDNHAPMRREDALSEPLGGFISLKMEGSNQRSRRKTPMPSTTKTTGNAGVALQTSTP